MRHETRDLLVVILAGGQGRRIGGGKPERLLGGERLIDRAIAKARQWSDHVAVAPGKCFAETIVFVPQVTDQEGVGPIAGLLAGVRHARSQGLADVLTIACDTPFLPPDLAVRLADGRPDNCAAAIPQAGAQLHPSCGLWNSSIEDSVLAYIAEGRRSLIGLAERIGYEPVLWSVVDGDPFFNVNTPDDLARAEELLRSR